MIIVSGFGRCGTSLVMQMLAAAGISCCGKYPAFEDDFVMRGAASAVWQDYVGPRAVKVIYPAALLPDAALPARGIWLDRDCREQARSQVKFIGVNHVIANKRAAVRAFSRRLLADRPGALRALGKTCAIGYRVLSFEDIILDSRGAAAKIAAWVGLPGEAVPAMSEVVRFRSPRCYNGLMEIELMESTLSGCAPGSVALAAAEGKE